jgi:hypothetical protein
MAWCLYRTPYTMHVPEVSSFEDLPISFVISEIDAAADTEYFTPQQIAELLKVSVDTVVRKFENRPGVLNLGSAESRFTRRYRTIRIPRTAFEAFVTETSVT